jgi:hypothetical protein
MHSSGGEATSERMAKVLDRRQAHVPRGGGGADDGMNDHARGRGGGLASAWEVVPMDG